MSARIISTVRSVAAALSLLAFLVAFVLGRMGGAPLAVVLAAAIVGVIALAIAVGPGAILSLFGRRRDRRDDGDAESADDAPEWWLARFEPAVGAVWDRQADYALAVGLGIVGVGALAVIATRSGDDPPLQLVVLGLLCLNGALIAVAGAAMNE